MILKWPGGKKWLLKEVAHLIPQKINNYIEPFIGGGSFFFALKQQDKLLPSYIQKGYLSDTNQKLINFYSELKSDPAKLYRNSVRLINNHTEEEYYKVRDKFRKKPKAHSDGSVIILSEKEREYIDVVLESSESHEFALNQFLGFFRNGKNDFNKWVYNDKKDKYEKKKFKIASFRSNSGSGRKQNVFTFSIEPRDMLKISTVSHQKAKNIFEFGRSTNKYYQRLLTGKRLKEIGTHLQDKKTPFPNNILVSHRGKKLTFEIDKLNENLTNTGRVPGKLVFDGCPGTFHVIDGQHRLFGYMGVDDKPGGLRDSHRLIVTVFDELTVDEEAEIFLEVNEKSQKVASDLIMEIDWATESESKSNMCNGVIFHLRDDENSVLFDRIAPAEEKRKKGLQPWDLKPTDLKNVISKFSVIGSKEDYINGIFYESDYNTSSKKLANHLNSMLRVLEERSGFWHGKIDSRKKDMAWFTNDMLKSPKGFLQNLITKGIFLLCDRITQWCYNRNRSQSLKNLTDECIKIMEEISTGFNKLPISERKKYFDVKNKYGQGDQGIDKVGSLFLVNFLDEKKYEGLITESDRMAVNSDEAPSQEDYDEAMAKLESLNEQIQLLTSPQERAQMLEEDFGKKIHYIFAKIFGENYWFNMFFREDSLKKHVVKAEEVRKEEEKELKGDPDFKLGMHDHDIEWLQWVDWIDIIKTLVTTDYYEKKYKKEAISESLEKLFQSLFYTDSIKPIKSCNWKDGTHWMERYNVLRRKGVHRRSAKITPKQIQQLVDLEPKVQEKISIITKFVNS